jgi:GxxExxY protein
MIINQITEKIIGSAISVHKELGPGLLESAYRACVVHELRKRDMHVETEKEMSVVYKGVEVDCGYRIDLIVQGSVVVELKAVERLEPIHAAQVLTYLKLAGLSCGSSDKLQRHVLAGWYPPARSRSDRAIKAE